MGFEVICNGDTDLKNIHHQAWKIKSLKLLVLFLSIEKEVRQIVCYNVVRKKWDLNSPTPHSPLLSQEPQ